ncbi:MAG TPA: DNA ligase D [Verrucomicrobiae bacterium]|nr:DNA ligase D [Verrucomicrobiae bacterium]
MVKALDEYAAKRSFGSTPEPAPAAAPGQGPLLFVVQMHAASRLHYDFRLECDGVLKSWAVPKGPSLNPADKRMAVMTEDHPYDYGSFEGVIPPKQYGAGEVIVWDCGVYSPDEAPGGARTEHWYHDRAQAEKRIRTGLAKGKLSFTLRGEKLKGSFALVRMAKDPKTWLLIKHKDRFASTADVTLDNRSPLSTLTVKEVQARKLARRKAVDLAPAGPTTPLPARIEPMLADLAADAFTDDAWAWEPKLDGYRVHAQIRDGEVRLQSRRNQNYTSAFPRLVAELRQQMADGMVIDGEIVALGPDGKPSFNALQNRVQLKTERELAEADIKVPAIFYAFDLLHFAGIDLTRRPYRDRRRYLSQCLLPSPLVQLVPSAGDGEHLRDAALDAGFEGVIGKRKDSRYEPGKRSGAWIKVKPTRSAEFVIGGYTRGKGAREAFGALLVGWWDRGKLVYVSNVGTGFDDRMITSIRKQLDARQRKTMPFAQKPDAGAPCVWVEPEMACEVKFHEITADGHLRAPVFVRMREDVDAGDVKKIRSPRVASLDTPAARATRDERGIEEVLLQLDTPSKNLILELGPHRISLSNLDRAYWPADAALKQPPVTKRDLLRYFAQVSPYIVPHLADRPLTMIRMPAGIHGQRFFQKHWEQAKPDFVDTVTVYSEHNEESGEYLVCNNLPTLLWLAQNGSLELHIWHSRSKLAADSKVAGTEFATSTASLETSILNYPDYVVFDIDPYIYSGQEKKGDEPELNTIAFEKGKEVAFWLRELLGTMKLEPIVKTSGKTGLHVFVPIKRTIDFDTARHVSELVGRHLMRQHPKDITMEWSIPKRTGKIFMDYNMNVRGKTLNVAYSPRGAPGAPVSMPLTWDELADAHPLDFRIANAPTLIAKRGDRWRDALVRKQSLEKSLKGLKG